MNIVTRNLFNKNGVLCGCSADTYSHVLCEWPIKDGPSGNVVEAQGSTVEQCEMVPFFGLTSIRLHLVRVQTDYPSPNCLQLVAAQETVVYAVSRFKGRSRRTPREECQCRVIYRYRNSVRSAYRYRLGTPYSRGNSRGVGGKRETQSEVAGTARGGCDERPFGGPDSGGSLLVTDRGMQPIALQIHKEYTASLHNWPINGSACTEYRKLQLSE